MKQFNLSLITTVLILLVASSNSVRAFSVRSILDKAATLFHFKTINELQGDANRDCAVHRFPAVDKIDAAKLSGDWFEIGRTITKIPIFSSSTWRFQSDHQNPDEQAFFFTGRLIDGNCCGPIVGSAISSNTNPGTFVMTYDGLKSRVEEELKVIFIDLNNALVLYGCSRLTANGSCLPEATFVAVLSRHKTLPIPVLNLVYEAISSVCIDPHTLIPQNTSRTCNLDDLDAPNWNGGPSAEGGEWPTCKKPATCTIACPRCCEEDSEGCISCDCGISESKLQSSPGACKKDANECDFGCLLKDKSPGCQVCDCHPDNLRSIQANAPMASDSIDIKKINNYGECPTSCRTPKIEDQLYCNCTNQGICHLPTPHVNCWGTEERYAYHPKTGTCPAYLGTCEDAINSFASVKECLATCADVCDLHVDVGNCKGNEERYYYNRVLRTCETFIYGGCQGNENNFKTKQECARRCPETDSPKKVKPEVDEICLLVAEKGSCENVELKYVYILERDTCVKFPYSGCGGNANNFHTEEACNAKCKIEGKGENQRTSNCAEQEEECLHPCTGQINSEGCIDCTCPGAATSLRMTLSNIVALIIVLFLTK